MEEILEGSKSFAFDGAHKRAICLKYCFNPHGFILTRHSLLL